MARDYITIGATPPEEPCIGVGHARATYSRQETAIYCLQLQREFPDGEFCVKGFDHDFGRYYEVVAYFDDGNIEDASDAAFQEKKRRAAFDAEGNCNGSWDEQALKELREQLGDWYFTEIRK